MKGSVALDIRVYAVSPGFTDTPPWHPTAVNEQSLKMLSNSVPVGAAGAREAGRTDMAEKRMVISVQDLESAADRQGAGIPGTNGNGAGVMQLPSVVGEPKFGAPETDGDNTEHEDERQEVKDTSSRPRGRLKRHLMFAVISIALLLGAVVGVRYWLHSRQ